MIITLYKFHQIKLKSHSIPFTFIKQKIKNKAEEQSGREHAEKGTASAFVLLFNSNNRGTEKYLMYTVKHLLYILKEETPPYILGNCCFARFHERESLSYCLAHSSLIASHAMTRGEREDQG